MNRVEWRTFLSTFCKQEILRSYTCSSHYGKAKNVMIIVVNNYVRYFPIGFFPTGNSLFSKVTVEFPKRQLSKFTLAATLGP